MSKQEKKRPPRLNCILKCPRMILEVDERRNTPPTPQPPGWGDPARAPRCSQTTEDRANTPKHEADHRARPNTQTPPSTFHENTT